MKENQEQDLQVLYRDEHYVAINKPPGFIVHKSSMTRNATEVVLQTLRNQLNQWVYPVHRLDRKTSGVLILSLSSEANRPLANLFQTHKIEKEYRAILRGWTERNGRIDYNLVNDAGKTQSAITSYKTLQHYEIDLPHGKFQTSRYSEVELLPTTGRMHQLRKHMAHIFHPILGDRPHGCNKQNRLWKDKFGMDTMLLHARRLKFSHPFLNQDIEITAPFFEEYQRVKSILKP
ncbi:MAG: pseudouridine synthase [Saprospiraceae bacterium]|nr:pseudouridine synthase [Saprospiraceae bacterium]